MTKFETVGINYQYSATSVEEATKMFSNSCNCCTHSPRCLFMDCDHCAIRQTHEQIVAILRDSENK